MTETDLVKALTLSESVAVYQQCEADLRHAYALLVSVEERLTNTFGASGRYFDVAESDRPNFKNPDTILKAIKKRVWGGLIDRMGVQSVMSVAKAKELEEQLGDRSKAPIPEITVENVLETLRGIHANIPNMAEEAVLEVFEILRPRGRKYKTNQPFEIGPKVILGHLVHISYNGYWVDHASQAELRALENVFSYLDGKGFVDRSFKGALVEALEKTTSKNNEAETEYFRVKVYRNLNVHITFKRPDLVAKLNQIAGGKRLRTPKGTPHDSANRL